MNGKYLGLATILGGLTLFIWGFVWHAANPFYEKVLLPFPDRQAANQSIKLLCPDNGMYMTEEGALAIISFTPDMADKTQQMGNALIVEIVNNLVFAFLLALIVGCMGFSGSVVSRAVFLGLIGFTAQIGGELSYWNWYGFTGGFVALNIIGEALAWFITGLVVCGLHAKFRKPAA